MPRGNGTQQKLLSSFVCLCEMYQQQGLLLRKCAEQQHQIGEQLKDLSASLAPYLPKVSEDQCPVTKP